MKCAECGADCEKVNDLPWICPECGWEEGDEILEKGGTALRRLWFELYRVFLMWFSQDFMRKQYPAGSLITVIPPNTASRYGLPAIVLQHTEEFIEYELEDGEIVKTETLVLGKPEP